MFNGIFYDVINFSTENIWVKYTKMDTLKICENFELCQTLLKSVMNL